MQTIRPAVVVFLALTAVTGILYPLAITLLGMVVMNGPAHGSLIRDQQGKVVGSAHLGQPFDDAKYFWSRPSATSPAYNGAGSTGSNLGPTNEDHHKTVAERIKTLREAHPTQTGPVPADLVTASASGLDPHISPAAAEYQAERIAQTRGMKIEDVRKLIAEHTSGRTLGVLGEARVHVLRLNLALEGK